MRYAIDESGKWIEVTYSGERATCLGCGTPVYGRVPANAVHHWAHVSRKECFYSGGGGEMTEWHIDWQRRLVQQGGEKEVTRRVGPKRKQADVFIRSTEFVIEFQHSSITGPEIREREKHYKRMAWVIDCTEWYPNVEKHPNFKTVWRWHAETSQLDRFRVVSKVPVFFDFGPTIGVLHAHTFSRFKAGSEPRGTGELMTQELFAERSISDWITKAVPIKHPEKQKVKRKAGSKREWKEGEIGDVCQKAAEVIRNQNILSSGNLTHQIAPEAGRVIRKARDRSPQDWQQWLGAECFKVGYPYKARS